jgi:hypothetical protein
MFPLTLPSPPKDYVAMTNWDDDTVSQGRGDFFTPSPLWGEGGGEGLPVAFFIELSGCNKEVHVIIVSRSQPTRW